MAASRKCDATYEWTPHNVVWCRRDIDHEGLHRGALHIYVEWLPPDGLNGATLLPSPKETE